MDIKQKKIIQQMLVTEKNFGADELPLQMCENVCGSGKSAVKKEDWTEFQREVLACRKCRLCEGRKNVVFGEGNLEANLMFIGEAPGYDEDIQGRPFVGKAGQLLTRIIEAMGLKREEVYIGNCLKCRPPNNRNPFPDEIALCKPYLLQQVERIQPKVICALGKFAAQTLLDTDTPISKLRGNFHDFHGVKLMPTFHPAYLLRNPTEKRLVWEDMQKIMRELGLELPKL